MKGKQKVLVCVTRQKTCRRLIEAGVSMAKEYKCPLSVMHVERPGGRSTGQPQ
ncbi:hypothetical protein LJB83_01460 [Clostridia bacterium OttesenSCG-928-F22]|nr:hypothetical protein [Clostridia bacterium OttesenSCG-928-F22]